MARMHMFQQNREMLIVIILEDMSIRRMPARLQQIWGSITCLEADDIVRGCSNPDSSHTFWKRLNQALLPRGIYVLYCIVLNIRF